MNKSLFGRTAATPIQKEYTKNIVDIIHPPNSKEVDFYFTLNGFSVGHITFTTEKNFFEIKRIEPEPILAKKGKIPGKVFTSMVRFAMLVEEMAQFSGRYRDVSSWIEFFVARKIEVKTTKMKEKWKLSKNG